MIARYHRHRIAAAIFEVTLSAQVTITHQRNPFPMPFEAIPPKLRARSPGTSVFQIVGTLILFYCPYYVTILWNSSVALLSSHHESTSSERNLQVPCIIMLFAFIFIHLTVFINIIIYGLKSKLMRKSLKNYWRKQKTKNEINNEIQARTPSTCGSRRPSISMTMNLSQSVSQRRLSETFVNINHLTNGNRPQIKRIASELSWQPHSNRSPEALLPHASSDTLRIPHHGSVESFDGGSGGVGSAGSLGVPNNEIRLNMMRSFRDKPLAMKSLSTTALQPIDSKNSGSSNALAKLPATYFHSKCKEVRRYLEIGTKKMFRIDLNDSHKRNEPLSSPLRSPQILITADSEESDLNLSPFNGAARTNCLEAIFDRNNRRSIHYCNDKSGDSSDDDNFPFNRYAMHLKRSRSLDGPNVSKYSGADNGECDKLLLLSCPPTRKIYKSVPNISPFIGDDQCDRHEI